jgi:hypothetical protein
MREPVRSLAVAIGLLRTSQRKYRSALSGRMNDRRKQTYVLDKLFGGETIFYALLDRVSPMLKVQSDRIDSLKDHAGPLTAVAMG